MCGLLRRFSVCVVVCLQTLLVDLSATDGEPLVDPTRYRHIVGSLVYIGVTCPNISYSVNILVSLFWPHLALL